MLLFSMGIFEPQKAKSRFLLCFQLTLLFYNSFSFSLSRAEPSLYQNYPGSPQLDYLTWVPY